MWLSEDIRLTCLPREAGVESVQGAWTSLVYRSEAGERHTLLLVHGDRGAESHDPAPPDLQSLCRESFAALDVDAREKIIEFLTSSLRVRGRDPVELSRSLLVVRDALRERLPYATSDSAPALHVDAVVTADPHHVLVTGWMTEADGGPGSLVAVSPEGARIDLSGSIYRHRHRLFDGARGFTASCDLQVPTFLADGWRVELRRADRSGVEVRTRPAISTLASARRAALDVLGPAEQRDALLRHHLFPALDRLQRTRRAQMDPAEIVEFGRQVSSPSVSIVIAIGDRDDLVEHQLAHVSGDPDCAAAELIYVVDAPASRERFVARAGHLSELYRVPIRAALLAEYTGVAGSISAGAACARGALLVLMSAETVPETSGWISRLRAASTLTAGIGPVVPRTRSVREATPEDRTTLSAAVAIERAFFDELGGLAGRYIGVEFEIADLCRRASLAGRAAAPARDSVMVDVRGEPRLGAMPKVERMYDEWVFDAVWGHAAIDQSSGFP